MTVGPGSRWTGNPETSYSPNPPRLPNLKNSADQAHALLIGLMPPGFPAQQCRRIDVPAWHGRKATQK